jgi:hypothetical protein
MGEFRHFNLADADDDGKDAVVGIATQPRA